MPPVLRRSKMRHVHPVGNIPQCAEGLCDNITTVTQARYCFVLSFLTDFIVPLVQPIITWKTTSGTDTTTETDI